MSSFNLTEGDFVLLFKNNYASFCNFANRYLNNPGIAEEIVSDVALKVWEKRINIQKETALKSYFYASIRNACFNWVQNKRSQITKKNFYLTTVDFTERSFVENIIREETLQLIEEAIETLPPQCRKVFLKLFVEGKSLSEAAQEMNLSLYTVKSQRSRGIKLLRKRLPPTAFSILLLCLQKI